MYGMMQGCCQDATRSRPGHAHTRRTVPRPSHSKACVYMLQDMLLEP